MASIVNNRELRKWIYSLIVAAGPLAVFYGLATAEEVALWLGFGASVLGIAGGSLALANLTPKDSSGEPLIIDGEVITVEEDEYIPRHAEVV